MDKFRLIDVQLYAIFVNLILIFGVHIKKREFTYSGVFFLMMCATNALYLMIDGASWFLNGTPGPAARYALLAITNLNMAIYPAYTVLWLYYIELNLTGSFRALRKKWYYFLPVALSAGLTLISLFNGMVVSVDADNFIRRGWGMGLIAAINWAVFLYLLLIAFVNRHRVEYRITGYIVFFTLLPVAASVIQIAHFGVSLIVPSCTLLQVGIFFFLEIRSAARDPLTGLLNRRQLDQWLEFRMNAYPRKGPFHLIVVDVDDFKGINDTWGHDKGDSALKTLADIFHRSIKMGDKAARFGGDEFTLVLETGDTAMAEEVMRRLQHNLDGENRSGRYPFAISYSYGYARYDPADCPDMNDLFRKADLMMYGAKKKQAISQSPTIM